MIWGDRFDAWTTLWLIDHLAERLSTWNWDPMTTDILYPLGYNLWSFGHMALQLIGGALVAIGLPLIFSYNLLLLAGIWTSALSAHALGRELTGSHRAGGVAGITFATTPYLYAEGGAGCIELVAAGLLPLYAMCLIRLLRKPSRSAFVLATLALAIIGLFNWYYTLFAGLLGLGIVLWQLIDIGPSSIRAPHRSVHRLGLIMAVGSMVLAAAINAPLIAEARRETPTRPGLSAELFGDEIAFEEVRSVTNGSQPIQTLDEATLERVDAMQVHFNSTSIRSLIDAGFEVNPLHSTPGSLAYLVGIFGLLAAGRRTWGWVAIATGATVLTLGPFLNVSGALLLPPGSSNWPLPYYWAHEYLPFFSKAYRPYRIGIIATTALSAAGAIGAAAWIRSSTLPSIRIPLLVLGLAAFSQPHWSGDRPAQRPMADATVKPIYTELAALETGAVIELPLQYQPVTNANARTQYNQVVHGHPILNSNQLIRRPDLLRFRDFVSSNSALHTFVDLSRKELPFEVEPADIDALKAQGFRWIVAHRQVREDTVSLAGQMAHADLLPTAAWQLLSTLFGEPTLDNTESVVWDLNAALTGKDPIQIDGKDLVALNLMFDPVQTGFPLVLHPGQTASIYQGPVQRLTGWFHGALQSGDVTLRIDDAGIVREIPLPLTPGHWQYVDIPINAVTSSELMLVGRGDGPVRLNITQAMVMP
jgi:hypothetical protein